MGMVKCDPIGLPLLNTCLLLSSALTLTVYHDLIQTKTKRKIYLSLTILLGYMFIYTQYIEYKYHLTFRLSDGVFGSTFYRLTGFHGSHVIIGILMLSIVYFSLNKYALHNCHLGLRAAI